MAGYEIRFADKVLGTYWIFSKTQVRPCYAAGLFSVVLKISLNVHAGVVAYYFYGVFIGAYGAV